MTASGELMVSISEASTLVGVGKAALRRMLKDGRLEGYISPCRGKMRISISSLAVVFGLQAEEVRQAVAARRGSRPCNGEQLSPDLNGRALAESQPEIEPFACGRRRRTVNPRNERQVGQPSRLHCATNPCSDSGEPGPEARALLAAHERSYLRAREQYRDGAE